MFLDQSPLARSARSNPATHLKAFDEIRKTFAATHEARLRNYDAGRFSFNVEGGRCNTCQGNGFLTIDMQFLPDVMVRCPECSGTRYRPEILEVTYRGKNIAEVLDLTAREAFGFFRNRPRVQASAPAAARHRSRLPAARPARFDALRRRERSGSSWRASWAARWRRSIAQALPAHTVFLLDEPTAGLHPLDIVKLLEALELAGRSRPFRDRDRAQPRGHDGCRLDHRPGPRRRRRRRPGGGARGRRKTSPRSGTPTGEILARTLQPDPSEP